MLEPYVTGATITRYFATFVSEKAVVCLRRKFFLRGKWSSLAELSSWLGSSLYHALPTRMFFLRTSSVFYASLLVLFDNTL